MHIHLLTKPTDRRILGLFSPHPLTEEETEQRLADTKDPASAVWVLTFIGSRSEVEEAVRRLQRPHQ